MGKNDGWIGKRPKSYEQCDRCAQWKVLVWLHMCGACAAEHKRLTALAVVEWTKELAEKEARHATRGL